MMLLKNTHDVDALIRAVERCRGDVILRSADGRATYHLKDALSRYMAIGELLKPHGDEYEFFCERHVDEVNIMRFLAGLQNEALSA